MTEYEDIRTGRHCVLALHAHLVFVTKFRHPVFTFPCPATREGPLHPRPEGRSTADEPVAVGHAVAADLELAGLARRQDLPVRAGPAGLYVAVDHAVGACPHLTVDTLHSQISRPRC